MEKNLALFENKIKKLGLLDNTFVFLLIFYLPSFLPFEYFWHLLDCFTNT